MQFPVFKFEIPWNSDTSVSIIKGEFYTARVENGKLKIEITPKYSESVKEEFIELLKALNEIGGKFLIKALEDIGKRFEEERVKPQNSYENEIVESSFAQLPTEPVSVVETTSEDESAKDNSETYSSTEKEIVERVAVPQTDSKPPYEEKPVKPTTSTDIGTVTGTDIDNEFKDILEEGFITPTPTSEIKASEVKAESGDNGTGEGSKNANAKEVTNNNFFRGEEKEERKRQTETEKDTNTDELPYDLEALIQEVIEEKKK